MKYRIEKKWDFNLTQYKYVLYRRKTTDYKVIRGCGNIPPRVIELSNWVKLGEGYSLGWVRKNLNHLNDAESVELAEVEL